MTRPVVIDRRSRRVRALMRLWRRWQRDPGRAVGFLAGGTAALGRRAVRRRISGRDTPPQAPLIVSIGNLSLGGTGKTPVVCQLAKDLADRGYRGAILTRGYGSRLRGPLSVRADMSVAGDEARLMAAQVPGWTVLQARDRRLGLQAALALPAPPQIVILEDGHQTAGVGRHWDVVILDRWRCAGQRIVPESGLVFPWGPYREGAAGAARARTWLVELDDPPPATLYGMADSGRIAVMPFRRRVGLPDGGVCDPSLPYAIVSGIARPERFETDCTRLMGHPPALVARFDDHHDYRYFQLHDLQRIAAEQRVQIWLTTEKDRFKLEPLWSEQAPIVGVRLEIEWLVKETLPVAIEERLQEVGR